MIKIEKTYGVRGVANGKTLLRIQELICLARQQYPLGKAVIDAEKITYYKFGLKLGLHRFATNGLVINEEGIIRDDGFGVPMIYDHQVINDLYSLFGEKNPFK